MPTTLSPADAIARRIAGCERTVARIHESIEFVRAEVAEGRRTDLTGADLDQWVDWQYDLIAEAIARRTALKAQAAA